MIDAVRGCLVGGAIGAALGLFGSVAASTVVADEDTAEGVVLVATVGLGIVGALIGCAWALRRAGLPAVARTLLLLVFGTPLALVALRGLAAPPAGPTWLADDASPFAWAPVLLGVPSGVLAAVAIVARLLALRSVERR